MQEAKLPQSKVWDSLKWGRQLGIVGRESCLWVALQQRLKRDCLLQEGAMERLDCLGFEWEPQVTQP